MHEKTREDSAKVLNMPLLTLEQFRHEYREGKYTSHGCYPRVWATINGALCHACLRAELRTQVRRIKTNDPEAILAVFVNWENSDLYCHVCDARIEAAYV